MSHEPTYPDPLSKAGSKALESVQFDRDFGGHVVVLEHAVPHRGVRPLSTAEQALLNKQDRGYPGTLIEAQVRNERNTNESRFVGRYFPTNGDSVVYPSRSDRNVDRSALARFADKTRMDRTYVARDAEIGTIGNTTISINQGLYSPELDAREVTVADAFTTREDVETDPDTGLMTKVVSEVVFALPTLSEQAAGKGVSYKEVATGIWIKETRTALKSDGTDVDPGDAAAFWSFTWSTREEYVMPGYMYLVETSGPYAAFVRTFSPQQRRTIVQFRPPVRFPFRTMAKVRYTESLHAAQPAFPANIRNFAGKDWVHSGFLADINIKGILMDLNTISLSTLAGDSYYGAYTETITTSETQPINAFEYRNSMLGSYQLVEVTISRAANKTFRMLQKEVMMQGNPTPLDGDVGVI